MSTEIQTVNISLPSDVTEDQKRDAAYILEVVKRHFQQTCMLQDGWAIVPLMNPDRFIHMGENQYYRCAIKRQ